MQHKWTRDDTILVLDYYYTMRRGDDRPDNPEIQHLAELIGITPASVIWKLLNCRALCPRPDFPPARTPASKLHKAVFEEFKNSRSTLRAEAKRIKAAAYSLPGTSSAQISDLASIPIYLTSPDKV